MIQKTLTILLATILLFGIAVQSQVQLFAQNQTLDNETAIPVDEDITGVIENDTALVGNDSEIAELPGPESPATSPLADIQIAAFDQVQRGQRQYVTVVGFDENDQPTNDTAFRILRVLESGRQLPTLAAQSGQQFTYKVGPNTAPQEITLIAEAIGTDLNASKSYDVYAKGQKPGSGVVIPPPIGNNTGNITIPPAQNASIPPLENATIPPLQNVTIPPFENVSAGNETGNITAPPSNVTGNVTEPIPVEPGECALPPCVVINGTSPPAQNVTVLPSNETDTIECVMAPCIIGDIGNATGNVTAPPSNATAPPFGNTTNGNGTVIEPPFGNSTNGNVTSPPSNATAQPPANATTSFEGLQNATAILEQNLEAGDENGNETDRAEIKASISETLTGFGNVASQVVTATNFQLGLIGGAAESVSEGIDQILD
jgi:hypothetical protein